MKYLISLLLLASLAPAQQNSRFAAILTGSVSSTGALVLTVQEPTSNGVQALIESVQASCAGETFTVDQSVNGSAASTTAVSQTLTGTLAIGATGYIALWPTAQNVNGVLAVYKASNVGTGVAQNMTLSYPSGGPVLITPGNPASGPFNGYQAYTPLILPPGSTGFQPNYTVTMTNTGMSSCTGFIQINWRLLN